MSSVVTEVCGSRNHPFTFETAVRVCWERPTSPAANTVHCSPSE